MTQNLAHMAIISNYRMIVEDHFENSYFIIYFLNPVCHASTMMECFIRNLQPHLDVLDRLFESIVPKAIVQPQPDKLQRGLGTKRVFSRHVEVIHEVDELLTANRHINTL